MRFKIHFERIGRQHNPDDLEVEILSGTNIEAIAEQLESEIYTFVRPKMASRHFDIQIDLSAGEGWIEGGRFGKFTIDEVGE